MRKNKKSSPNKLIQALNASSETFMLIALVSLFAIPFVISANLEPMVVSSKRSATAFTKLIPSDKSTQTASNVKITPTQNGTPDTNIVVKNDVVGEVLGVSKQSKSFVIKEEKVNLSYFAESKSSISDKLYKLDLRTPQIFGKIFLFTLKNDSTDTHLYKFNVVNNSKNDLSEKYLYIDSNEYLISDNTLPDNVTLEPGREVQFYIKNDKLKGADLSVSIELVK